MKIGKKNRGGLDGVNSFKIQPVKIPMTSAKTKLNIVPIKTYSASFLSREHFISLNRKIDFAVIKKPMASYLMGVRASGVRG